MIDITKIYLWDLPENEVYLKIKKQARNIFFNSAIKLVGNKIKLNKFLKISNSHRKFYESGKYFCPLWVIKKILNITSGEEKDKLMVLIEKNVEELRKGYGGKAKSIRNPNLLIKFSPTLCSIIGHIIGDGGIKQNYAVQYTNKSKFLIKQFERDVIETFGEMQAYIYHDKEDKTYTVNFSSIVGLILVTLIGQMRGESKHIPKEIFYLDKQNKRLFLRALFDDEGSISISKHNIEFIMTNKTVVENIRKILREFGIRPSETQARRKEKNRWKIGFRFFITGSQDIKRFYEQINFCHPKKKRKLRKLIQSYKKVFYKKGEVRELIFTTLKREKRIPLKSLAKLLKRKPSGRFYMHLDNLEKKGIIIRRREEIILKNK
jgi:hypothetical protein